MVTCDTIKPADYKDYKEMVRREKLDIVSVCTPPETHRRIVTDIAPYVKAIYCEKPIALTLDDADAMLDCCAYHGVILQVNHQRTFTEPVFRFSRGIVNTGSHMFALLLQLFGEVKSLAAEEVTFQSGLRVRLEEQFTQEPVFQFDATHNGEPMIQKGIKHLIASLAVGCPSDASGERAREALRLCLELKRLKEGN